jgi:hypothetical protein
MSNLKQTLLHRNLHLKIHSQFFRPNKTHRLPQRQKSQLRGKERRNSPPIVTTSKINHFSVLKDLKLAITTDISTTYIQQGIQFHCSSEQDYKVGLNYFKFKKMEYYAYETAENKAYKVLVR